MELIPIHHSKGIPHLHSDTRLDTSLEHPFQSYLITYRAMQKIRAALTVLTPHFLSSQFLLAYYPEIHIHYITYIYIGIYYI